MNVDSVSRLVDELSHLHELSNKLDRLPNCKVKEEAKSMLAGLMNRTPNSTLLPRDSVELHDLHRPTAHGDYYDVTIGSYVIEILLTGGKLKGAYPKFGFEPKPSTEEKSPASPRA
jgi:hypothetical protein